MAMLPLPPTPFFGNKNRAFWRLQFLGWGGAMLLRAMSSLANAVPWSFLIIVIIATITGFSISLILSVIYRALLGRRALVTWGVTALVLAIAVGLYAFIDSWVTLLGAWSALYYAINFYIQVEEQNHQLLQLENQATSAQLAMLRYQLNPHFLFNTLNSISTLVLLKQTEPANAMLSRLSAFLRYTLINEPTAQVTVAQEVETLKLYLDIERMRFEDRLRTRFDIDEPARTALMPSLLLQPLVENAIKYAVSPLEEGAEITVRAEVLGTALRIVVSDTGPGLQPGTDTADLFGVNHDQQRPGSVSTGIGLANIRDRLVQAYGESQRFDIATGAEGGLAVTIELPFEPRDVPAPPARSVQPALNPATAG
jgi:LytS/YehU family sensor histidine kinase